jgi:hypothetical protein
MPFRRWLLANVLVECQLKVVMFAYRSTAADLEPEAVRDPWPSPMLRGAGIITR